MALPIASQVGTTANTGGAYLPDVYAGLSSLVAAAYAFARSGSITVLTGEVVVPSRSSDTATVPPEVRSSADQARPPAMVDLDW